MKTIIIYQLTLSIFILKNITTAFDFTLSSSLEQKSVIQVATNVWKNPLIISKIKDNNLLTSNFLKKSYIASPMILQRLKIYAFKIIESLELPIRKIDELIYIIEPIGKEMFNYLSEVYDRLGDPGDKYPSLIDYVDKIEWTADGQVDNTKTLMAVFNKAIGKNLPVDKIDYIFMFIEACKCSHADGINEIWQKLSVQDKQNIKFAISRVGSENIADKYPLDMFTKNIMKYWIFFYFKFGNLMNYNPRDTPIMRQGILETHNRVLLRGNTESLEYFLTKSDLDGDDKDYYIINTLLPNGFGFHNRMTANNFVFLMQQLSKEARLDYIKNHRNYLMMKLIDSWPWRYIYFDVFKASIDKRNPPTLIDYQNLLSNILEKIDFEYSQFRNVKQMSSWMVGKFWSDYKDHFDGGLIEACWSLTLDQFVKIQALIVIIKNWNIKKVDEKLIEECIKMGFMLRSLEFYDLLYDVGEYILKTQKQRYNFMQHVTLQDASKHFIIHGDRYDEIDRLIDWKFGRDNDKKANYKISINWLSIVREIQENEEIYDSINRKLTLLVDWLNFEDKQKSEFKKCIDKFFRDDSNLAEWNNFYTCAVKVENKKKSKCNKKG